MLRTVSNDLLTDIWLCMDRRNKSSFYHHINTTTTTTMTMNVFKREHCLFRLFQLVLQTCTHSHIHIRLVACLPIFSTGICETRCALNTQFICSMKFISLWLFNGFFFLSFFIFDVIFVGTAGANVALVLLYIAQCLLIPHRSLSLSFVFLFIVTRLFLFVAIDLNGRTSGNVHILTF